MARARNLPFRILSRLTFFWISRSSFRASSSSSGSVGSRYSGQDSPKSRTLQSLDSPHGLKSRRTEMTFPSSCLLPPALMELTLSRACHRTPVASFTRHGRNAGFFRSVATARQIEKSPDPYTAPSLYPHLGGRQKPREIARSVVFAASNLE